MPSLDGLLIVVAAGFAAPFLLGLAPALRIPAVVLEIVAGIVVGPSVLLFPAAGLALLQSTGPAPARAGRFGTT